MTRLAWLLLAVAACGPAEDRCAEGLGEVGIQVSPEVALGEAATLSVDHWYVRECPTELLWDLGDGTQSTEAMLTHTYAEPGHYPVVLRASGEDGRALTDSALITVYRPAAGPTSASSTLLATDEGLVTVAPDVGVSRVGEQGLARYTGCTSPRTAAEGAGGLALACEGDDALVLLDEALEELHRIDLGTGCRPYGVAWDGQRFWASCAGSEELLAVQGGAVVRRVPAADPRAVAVGPDGAIYATRFRSLDGQGQIAVVDGEAVSLAFADVVDSDNTTRGVPNLLGHLRVSPDGGTLYAPGQVSNTARGAWRDGQPLTHESTVRAVLRGVDTASGEEVRALDRQFDSHGRAGAMALSARGDWLWLAFPDTGAVFQIDAYTGRPVSNVPYAGRGLSGLALTAEGDLAVHAWLDRVVRVYDAETTELLAEWPTVQAEPLPADVLLGKQLFHDALDRRITADGYLSCAACHPDGDQDGLVWDFTDRGEGLRNTSSLLGRAGTGMGRLHWSGNFDEVQDFEHDIRGPFAGLGFLDEADWLATDDPLGAPKAGRSAELDALAAYLESLAATPTSPHPTDTTGEALFAELGCAVCHPAPSYTDSALADVRHDVGTLTPASGQRLGGALDGLDTPTLLGVHATGPWLHDGSAASVEEAIAAHEATALARSPSQAEIEAVAAFVRSL